MVISPERVRMYRKQLSVGWARGTPCERSVGQWVLNGFAGNLGPHTFLTYCRGWYMSLFGDFEHRLQIFVGDYIPNIWVMFNWDIYQPLY